MISFSLLTFIVQLDEAQRHKADLSGEVESLRSISVFAVSVLYSSRSVIDYPLFVLFRQSHVVDGRIGTGKKLENAWLAGRRERSDRVASSGGQKSR